MFCSLKRICARLRMFLKTYGLLFWLLWNGVNDMAMVYATLITKGRRTFESVPAPLQPQVKEILIDLDCGYLCGETEA